MALFLITYDLRQPGRDYTALHQAIRSLGNTLHPLESTWFLATPSSASAVRDALLRHVDRNDRLLVLESGKSAAWFGLANDDASRLKASVEAIS